MDVGEYSQRFGDFALDQRQCTSLAVGFDFLAHSLSHILDRYIKFYNNPAKYLDKTKNHKRVKDLMSNKTSIAELNLNVHLVNSQRAEIGEVRRYKGSGPGEHALVLQRAVKFEIEEKGNKARGKATGTLEFGLVLKVALQEAQEKNRWRFELANTDKVTIWDLDCGPYSETECATIREFLENKLAHDVFAFNQPDVHHFDQPTAAYNLIGLLSYINDYADRPIETTHVHVEEEQKVLYLFLNCKKASIEDALGQPIASDKLEISYYQNFLDNFGTF